LIHFYKRVECKQPKVAVVLTTCTEMRIV